MQQPKVLTQWSTLGKWPFGHWLFSKLIGMAVPYAASIDARVEVLEPGHARVLLRDRRAVRNHLRSIHAAALAHLAEMTANLALSTRQPGDARWIVTGMETRLLKKARGTIRAETTLPEVDWNQPQELVGEVTLRDADNDIVMSATQRWKIGAAQARDAAAAPSAVVPMRKSAGRR